MHARQIRCANKQLHHQTNSFWIIKWSLEYWFERREDVHSSGQLGNLSMKNTVGFSPDIVLLAVEEASAGGQVAPQSIILSQLRPWIKFQGGIMAGTKRVRNFILCFWVPSACVWLYGNFFIVQAQFPPDIIAPQMANSTTREDNEIITGVQQYSYNTHNTCSNFQW
jgi:hypothetical protein